MLIPECGMSTEVEVKKEGAEKEIQRAGRLIRFTPEEDTFLKKGIEIYGLGKWSRILHDKNLKFHPARTRDTLRVRADTIGISKKKKRTRKTRDTRQ